MSTAESTTDTTQLDSSLWGDLPADGADESPATPQASGLPSSLAPAPAGTYEGIIFDIETGPLPDVELWKVVAPFDRSSIQPYPAFDESSVKYGNTKDEALKAAKLQACREAHAVDAAAHAAKNATAEADYIDGIKSKAALSAITGRVLAIGYAFSGEEEAGIAISDGTAAGEIKIINDFWMTVEAADEHTRFIGHNIAGFDIPFLFQRSIILGVEVPRSIFKGRYLSDKFVDTMTVWACGKVGGNSFAKLDDLAKAFGVGAKNGSGAMFAELLEKDPAVAREYLANDIAITYAVAKRMRLCR